mgnify:CR=1 FL=1
MTPLRLISFIIGASFGKIESENLRYSSNYNTRLKFVVEPGLLSKDGLIALSIFLL